MTEDEKDALREASRIVAETESEIRRLLGLAAANVAATLAASPTEWQAWYLPQLQASIRDTLARYGELASTASAAAHLTGTAAAADAVATTLRVRAGIVLPAIQTAQLDGMKTFLTSKIKDVTVEIANRVNTELGLVVIGAKSPFEAIRAVEARLGGGIDRAATIVSTEVMRAYSAGAQAQAEKYYSMFGLVSWKTWRKSGKLNPRLNHVIIDGQRRRFDDTFRLNGNKLRMMYPRDPKAPAGETINCGCVALYRPGDDD
jgi:hypothetical protein